MENPTVIVIPAESSAGPRFATRPSVEAVGGRPPRRGILAGLMTAVLGVFSSAGGAMLVVLATGIAGSGASLGRGVAGLVLVIVAFATVLTLVVTAAVASLAFRRNRRTGVLWAVAGSALGLVGLLGAVSALGSLLA